MAYNEMSTWINGLNGNKFALAVKEDGTVVVVFKNPVNEQHASKEIVCIDAKNGPDKIIILQQNN